MQVVYSRSACHARDQLLVAASTHSGTSETSATMDTSSNSEGGM